MGSFLITLIATLFDGRKRTHLGHRKASYFDLAQHRSEWMRRHPVESVMRRTR